MIRETYIGYLQELDANPKQDTLKIFGMMKAILYKQALKNLKKLCMHYEMKYIRL